LEKIACLLPFACSELRLQNNNNTEPFVPVPSQSSRKILLWLLVPALLVFAWYIAVSFSGDTVEDAQQNSAPVQLALLLVNPQKDASGTTTYTATGLTEQHVTKASLEFVPDPDTPNEVQPVVSIMFDAFGKRQLAAVTSQHVGEQLAIRVNGEVVSAPIIHEPILDGAAIISGKFTPDEARELVRLLNQGTHS
jgi:preprotein translocase subunit SecD